MRECSKRRRNRVLLPAGGVHLQRRGALREHPVDQRLRLRAVSGEAASGPGHQPPHDQSQNRAIRLGAAQEKRAPGALLDRAEPKPGRPLRAVLRNERAERVYRLFAVLRGAADSDLQVVDPGADFLQGSVAPFPVELRVQHLVQHQGASHQIKYCLPRLAIIHRNRKKPEFFRKVKTFVSGYNSLFLFIVLVELAFMVVFFIYYLKISSLKKFVSSSEHADDDEVLKGDAAR